MDLHFDNRYLGDLKAHTNGESGILGNDTKNFLNAIEQNGKVWYIVFNHNTIKDKDKKNEVTKFWNAEINKENPSKNKDLNSYGTRMKNEIQFTDFQILEFNKNNIQHLSDFNQGKNSNGNYRNTKIKIEKSKINNFLIHISDF